MYLLERIRATLGQRDEKRPAPESLIEFDNVLRFGGAVKAKARSRRAENAEGS